MTKKMLRNSNIELLRIIATLGVIVLHYNHDQMGGGFEYVEMGSINSYIMYFLENIFICAVNVFVLISGYFMSEKKKVNTFKAVELLVEVIAFNAAILVVQMFLAKSFFSWEICLASLLPKNYYVTLYISVYLLSPYINLFVNKLTNASFRNLLILLILILSVWPTFLESISLMFGGDFSGMNTIGIGGSQGGYTIVNFVLMYLIGAYIKRINPNKPARIYLIKLCICWVILFVCSYILTYVGIGARTIWAYCNPFVILSAIYSFLVFNNIKGLKSRAINEISKASFTVYLLHMLFLSKLRVNYFVEAHPIIYILHVIGSCIGIYLICFLIYKIYDTVMDIVFRYVKKFINFPEITCIEK